SGPSPRPPDRRPTRRPSPSQRWDCAAQAAGWRRTPGPQRRHRPARPRWRRRTGTRMCPRAAPALVQLRLTTNLPVRTLASRKISWSYDATLDLRPQRGGSMSRVVRITTAIAAPFLVAALIPSAAAAPPGPPPAEGCDPFDSAACVLPFPNDYFTVPDSSTDTGLRVAFADDALPANALGRHIDPTEWNRNDGFSPGSPVLTAVPGVDVERTGAAPITDIGASLAPAAPILLLNTRTGGRHPYWAELDSRATDPERQVLIVRPARNFDEN